MASTAAAATGDPAGPLAVEIRDGIGIAELNRPEKFNCLSSGLIAALDAAIAGFEADSTVRVMLVLGAGKNFCTGADLDELAKKGGGREALRAYLGSGSRLLRRLERCRLPVVAACQGLSLAGGLEVMMACDVVLAAETAQFGDQHARYALVPGFGGTQRLPRLVGLRRALELMYSGRWIAADEALSWGLVNFVVPDAELRDRALAYAADLAKKSRPGLAAMKRLSREGLEGGLDTGLALELDTVVDALRSADVKEGMAAFAARREPVYRQ
jgi:enoyl-CoA hydratase